MIATPKAAEPQEEAGHGLQEATRRNLAILSFAHFCIGKGANKTIIATLALASLCLHKIFCRILRQTSLPGEEYQSEGHTSHLPSRSIL